MLQTHMLKIQRSIIDESAENADAAIRCGVWEDLLRQDRLQELHPQAPAFSPAILLAGIEILEFGVTLSIACIQIGGFASRNPFPHPFFGLSPIR
jgi:hypothetical protein